MRPRKAVPKSELEALAFSGSEFEMVDRLETIAGRYGKLTGIQRLPTLMQARCDCAVFLVDFESSTAADAASRELNCPVVGFATLLVSVARSGMVVPAMPRRKRRSRRPDALLNPDVGHLAAGVPFELPRRT